MKDKVSQACDYILDKIENGEYKVDEAIPAARKLTQEVGASFAIVQHAVNVLSNAGILRSISRQGTVVREEWQSALMANHLVLFNRESQLLWVPGFRKLLAEKMPELRLCRAFQHGMFELRPTLDVQQHRNEYLDLAPYFNELFPDSSQFFDFPFQYFKNPDGSMFAVPFIFSPRVIFYNRTVLRQNSCPEPQPGWYWNDFIAVLKHLKQTIPSSMILNYNSAPFFWINFVFRCGGSLLEQDPENPVKIDSPETMAGIRAVRELAGILEKQEPCFSYLDSFVSGKTAFLLSEREILCYLKHRNFDDWGVVPMPRMPGGKNVMAQAADLICVRKECVDPDMIRSFLAFMLSEEVQDYIAAEKYGIPIRKSSAQKSIDLTDRRDLLFLTEMGCMSAEYNLDSPELMELIQNGISQIIQEQDKPLEKSLERLADAVRIFLEIKRKKNRQAYKKQPGEYHGKELGNKKNPREVLYSY